MAELEKRPFQKADSSRGWRSKGEWGRTAADPKQAIFFRNVGSQQKFRCNPSWEQLGTYWELPHGKAGWAKMGGFFRQGPTHRWGQGWKQSWEKVGKMSAPMKTALGKKWGAR